MDISYIDFVIFDSILVKVSKVVDLIFFFIKFCVRVKLELELFKVG